MTIYKLYIKTTKVINKKLLFIELHLVPPHATLYQMVTSSKATQMPPSTPKYALLAKKPPLDEVLPSKSSSVYKSLGLESSTQPLSHCAPYLMLV